jgi:hypothetical protein
MPEKDARRKVRLWWVLGGALALAGVCALLHFLVARDRGAGGGQLAKAAPPARSTNPPALARAGAAPAPAGPEVAELLRLMRDWREKNPVYHMVMETSGADVSTKTEFYRFRNEKGRVVHRLRNQILRPFAATFIVAAENDQMLAYFPLSNQTVEINHEQEKAKLAAQLGWTGESLEESALFSMAKAVFAETGPDYKALTIVLAGSALQMPPTAGDLFLTVKLDETGKTIGLEQLMLMTRMISKMTYLAEDNAGIGQGAPQIPPGAPRTKKSLREALQEEVLLTKTQPSKTI